MLVAQQALSETATHPVKPGSEYRIRAVRKNGDESVSNTVRFDKITDIYGREVTGMNLMPGIYFLHCGTNHYILVVR